MNSPCELTPAARAATEGASLPNSRLSKLLPMLVCPDCRIKLAGSGPALQCPGCNGAFSLQDGSLKLWPPSRTAELEASISGFKGAHRGVRENAFFRSLLPPSPICDPGERRRHAQVIEAMGRGQLVVNLGSKSAQWGEHVVSVDLVKPKDGNVDMLADIQRLPFADASIDGVICTYVLEHVADARACIDEIARVVKPGGHVFVTVPFLFPTHPDPLDRWRWTLDGLRYSMSGFEEVSAGNAGGPFSALVSIVPTLMGSVFSNFYLFNGTRFLLGWLMWPLKFLDWLAWRSAKGFMASPNFYFFGRRR